MPMIKHSTRVVWEIYSKIIRQRTNLYTITGKTVYSTTEKLHAAMCILPVNSLTDSAENEDMLDGLYSLADGV